MVALEKAGIPAVGIVAKSFVRAWQSCVDGWGNPNTGFVQIPHGTAGQSVEYIHKMVDEQIDNIIKNLTQPVEIARLSKTGRKATEVVTLDLPDGPEAIWELNKYLSERDWNDGQLCFPATPQKVEAMLKGTKRAPQDVLMIMEPGFAEATVEKVAINAVMAGCRPEHMPILVAAIEALADPHSNHRDMMVSSHTEAPILLINGPITKKGNIQYDVSAMGPGAINEANTAVGKALRLCLTNIGHCKPGEADGNFIGLPTKFGMVIAENEETSPWDPYHMDLGYKRSDSTVTLVTVTGPVDVIASGDGPEVLLDTIAKNMDYQYSAKGGWLRGHSTAQIGNTATRIPFQGPFHPIVISPSRAVVLQNGGYSKKAAQEYLWNKVRVPIKGRQIPKGPDGKWLIHPEWTHLENDPEGTVPALESPDQYILFVSGGTAFIANFFYGTYGISTKLIDP